MAEKLCELKRKGKIGGSSNIDRVRLVKTETKTRDTQSYTATKPNQLVIVACSCANGAAITSTSVTGNAIILNAGESNYIIGGANISIVLLKSIGDTVSVVQRSNGNYISGTMYVIDLTCYSFSIATLSELSGNDIPKKSLLVLWSSTFINSISVVNSDIVVSCIGNLNPNQTSGTTYGMSVNVIATYDDVETPILSATPTHKLLITLS